MKTGTTKISLSCFLARIGMNRDGMRFKNIGLYLRGLVLVAVTICIVFQGRLTRLDIPLTYGAMEALSVIDGNLWRTDMDMHTGTKFFNQVDLYPTLSGVKSFIEGGAFSTKRLNSPSGFNSASFPTPSSQGQFLILKVLSYFSESPGVVINFYFLFSIWLIYSMVFALLLRVSSLGWYSLVGSTTFTMSSSLYGKEQLFIHLGLIPTIITLSTIHEISQHSTFRIKKIFISSLAIATFGLYGAIFSLLITLFALIVLIILNRNSEAKSLSKFLGFQMLLVSIMFYLSVRSSLTYWKTRPMAPVLNRSIDQIENWPFRLIDALATPSYSHFVPEILHRSNFVPSYDFGEGVYTFGPYGIVAIGAAIYYLIKLSGSSKNQNVSNSAELYLFSSLMVIICLSAPKGGLLPAISGVVEIPIKSWERLETPLSLIAIMILGLMLTNVEFAQKRARKMRSRFQFLHVLVATTLGIGFLSAQPLGVFNNENAAVDRWDRERSFFQDIEQTYGNIRILQLPKMTFPEGPPVLGVPPYSDFIAHFHSDSLRLSAGEVVEATNFNFEFDLSGSLKALVEKARLLSYEGLLFDRRAISEEFYFELENHGGKLCSAFEKNWKTNFIFCKIN